MAGREDSEWKLEGLGLIPFQHSQGPVSTFASKRVSGSGENRIQLARQTFLLLQRNIALFSFPISSFVSESGHRKRYEFSPILLVIVKIDDVRTKHSILFILSVKM